MNDNHEYFMDVALEHARAEIGIGGRPIGSVIVKDGKIVGRGINTVVADKNPSAHAEVEAIRDACSKLRTLDLSGSTLYTTMEPCPACLATAILEAQIKRVVLGGRHARLGRKDLGDYSVESFLAFTKRDDVAVIAGVREAECDQLRSEWLRSLSDKQLRLETLRSLSA
ncbi:MAG: nucleoside deaminase [Betaproteobacteria bacterium]|nr:nucleoside deaminase [Betaproteobacteria bacterium]